MEGTSKSEPKDNNGFTKEIIMSPLEWAENITAINLSNKNLATIDNVNFPPNLVELNLSHNKLTAIPDVINSLQNLKTLDMSYNQLEYFDETPNFCHSIVDLNLSHNKLSGPPFWIWVESPANLVSLDLSFNEYITASFHEELSYFEELLKLKPPVSYLKMSNCNLKQHLKLIPTFTNIKGLELGTDILTSLTVNRIIDFPFEGLEQCCDNIESLNLRNTHLYNIKSNIDIFSKLIEINLSQNYISGLPKEFCNLQNLKTCILSNNSILYLPDDFGNLKNLVKLCIDSNELCLLPESLVELNKLECLDIYNNCLYEYPVELPCLTEVDYAQNYFDEPNNPDYIDMKQKIRSTISGRCNGRKIEAVRPDSDYSPCTSDDECTSVSNNSNMETYERPSSPEDWDSDDYWVPRHWGYSELPTNRHQAWLEFVKKKMAEGNFCPMDAHMVSIGERVRYEKQFQNRIDYESDGQFDDYPEDES